MHKKKIKIFLGGYVNYSNAQNLNCLALANYLDPSKFIVYSLSAYFTNKIHTNAILFHCFFPFRISSFLGFLWGVAKCDVAYFPKHKSPPIWIIRLSRLFGKKIFTTIENNMCDTNKESMLNSFGGRINLVNYFKYIPNIFGITKYIVDNSNCGVVLEKKVLYLGVNFNGFNQKKRTELENIVFVGTLKKRKRVEEFLELAKHFPKMSFNVIGDGVDSKSLRSNASKNVTFFGQLNQQELASRFNYMDLLFLPSKSEGFPKVILEAAASGIPSVVYSEYGASEWISNANNGFVINNYEQLISTIEVLINNKDLLTRCSEGAILMAKRFDWMTVIKDWEKAIYNLR